MNNRHGQYANTDRANEHGPAGVNPNQWRPIQRSITAPNAPTASNSNSAPVPVHHGPGRPPDGVNSVGGPMNNQHGPGQAGVNPNQSHYSEARKPAYSSCFVRGCCTRRNNPDGFGLFHLPIVLKVKNHNISLQRYNAWLAAIKCIGISDGEAKRFRVCGRHFVSGKCILLGT